MCLCLILKIGYIHVPFFPQSLESRGNSDRSDHMLVIGFYAIDR